jgi:heme-degrading monooxygenase HmoA
MYSRVTLLEIDTVRVDIADAAELFRTQVAPGLAEQEGYEGAVALVTPEGKGMIVTFWDTAEEAQDASGFASAELERNVTMFKSPPGREYYEVTFADMEDVSVASLR